MLVSGEIGLAKFKYGEYELEIVKGPHKGSIWWIEERNFNTHFAKTEVRAEDLEELKNQTPKKQEHTCVCEPCDKCGQEHCKCSPCDNG